LFEGHFECQWNENRGVEGAEGLGVSAFSLGEGFGEKHNPLQEIFSGFYMRKAHFLDFEVPNLSFYW
jgi:hypothetical protein